MSSAAPASPKTATVWSMPPVGAPTTSVSARMQASISSRRRSSVSSRPIRSARATATEHSSAADDESPAPTGTRLSTSRSTPGTRWPASRSAQMTPAA